MNLLGLPLMSKPLAAINISHKTLELSQIAGRVIEASRSKDDRSETV